MKCLLCKIEKARIAGSFYGSCLICWSCFQEKPKTSKWVLTGLSEDSRSGTDAGGES